MVAFRLIEKIMGCEMYMFSNAYLVKLKLLRKIKERPSKHNRMFEI